jgi:hypothetical protein
MKQKALTEGPAFHDTLAFADGDELAAGDTCILFYRAQRPMDLDVRGGCGAQSKVQARVV